MLHSSKVKNEFECSRKELLHWLCLFYVAHIFLFFAISFRYRVVMPVAPSILAEVFSFCMGMGHFAFLGLILFMPIIVLTVILPKRFLVLPISILLGGLGAFALLVDTYVFQLYRTHIDAGVIELLVGGAAGDIFVFSTATKLKALAIVGSFVAMEIGVGAFFWYALKRGLRFRLAAAFLSTLALLAFTQNMLYACADGFSYLPITQQAGMLPAYPRTTMRRALERMGFELPRENMRLSNMQTEGSLKYPLTDLKCTPPRPLPNILFLIIDSWRFDTISREITPNISELAESSMIFANHFSGGSATRSGIFSLFYSLPASYWHSMLSNRRGPVFISELIKDNYDIEAHGSAALNSPEFDQTAFVDVKDLRVRAVGKTAADRDKDIAGVFKSFLEKRDKARPFFGMLFFDAPHSFSVPDDEPRPFQPSLENVDYMALNPDYDPKPFFNLYLNSIHFNDALVGDLLKTLDRLGLKNGTIIVVTGDHGQEFNENGLNYWGHNGNFSRFQAGVPLLIHWPGKAPAVFDHRTSHFDIIPTLMREVLGCSNDFAEYAVGKSLLDRSEQPFLLLGNYSDYAIVEEKRITMVRPYGGVEVLDQRLRPLNGMRPDRKLLLDAMEQQSRFFAR